MDDQIQRGRIVIAGGSGFLGLSLAAYLAGRGKSVILLSRNAPRVNGPWRHAEWDGRTSGAWRRELDGAEGLVNLAGRSVDCIKTPDKQDEIVRSRVEATRALGQALREITAPPSVWVQMSTAHIYGDPPSAICTESSAFGAGFAPFVGRAWEEEFAAQVFPGQRAVVLRTSFVLGRDHGAGGGPLARLAALARFGMGGKSGSGKQGVSWIHAHDMNRLFDRALSNVAMQGAYIASSPNPVSQATFMREMRRAVKAPFGLALPSWLVAAGARFILRTDPELALYGRYVVSKRLEQEGFKFEFSHLRVALANLLARPARG